jgi:hypothetical protein
LDRPSAVKRGSGRPSLDSASGVVVSGFALMRGVNHSGFRSGRVLIDRFPDSFLRTDNHEPPQLGKSRVLSPSRVDDDEFFRVSVSNHSASDRKSCIQLRSACGRSPDRAHMSKRREGLTGFRGGSLGAVRRYGASTAYARHPERSIRETPFFCEGKRNHQPHQPEELKLKDNAKMGNGFRSQ